MSRRILIVEPDAAGRAMMDRVMAGEGYAPEAVAHVQEVTAELDQRAFELAIVAEMGDKRGLLEDVRDLRRRYPALPIIVTGALLSQRVMQELLRLQVMDALAKPFTPGELRDAVARALDRTPAHHVDALEYAAAIAAARRAIAEGRIALAAPALTRAQAIAPLDAETIALWALLAELDGRDGDADRGYRAALALRHDEDMAPPDPYEGLARLGAYGPCRPVRALDDNRRGSPAWIITDPARELREGAPAAAAGVLVVLGLGLASEGPGAIFLRDGEGPRAFAVMAGALRPEAIAAVLARLGAGPIIVDEAARERLDVARIAALSGDHAGATTSP